MKARYLHAFRERRLSDHAPLAALFEPMSKRDTQPNSDYIDYDAYSGDDGDRLAYSSNATSDKE